MTGLRTYLALISAGDGKTPISETLMRTAKRMLGPRQTPVAAWPTGFLTAFRSEEPAQLTADRLVREIDQRFRVAVLELGPDTAHASVLKDHADWIADLARQD
jgi:hypothetical protein